MAKKTPIEREYEYLIRRAKEKGQNALALQLEEKYEEVRVFYLDDLEKKND